MKATCILGFLGVALVAVGCLGGGNPALSDDADLREADALVADEALAPAEALAWGDDRAAAVVAPERAVTAILPDDADLSLCRSEADRRRSCRGDQAEPFDIAACASRFACSRRLWRADLQPAVYTCLRELDSCEDDPELLCLLEAAADVPRSAAEETFERALVAADQQCGSLLEVAAGQADVVYAALGFCLTENEGCAEKAQCSRMALEAIVAERCGALESI